MIATSKTYMPCWYSSTRMTPRPPHSGPPWRCSYFSFHGTMSWALRSLNFLLSPSLGHYDCWASCRHRFLGLMIVKLPAVTVSCDFCSSRTSSTFENASLLLRGEWNSLLLRGGMKFFASKRGMKFFASKRGMKFFASKRGMKFFASKREWKFFASNRGMKFFASKKGIKILCL